jgi:hypothetical protein
MAGRPDSSATGHAGKTRAAPSACGKQETAAENEAAPTAATGVAVSSVSVPARSANDNVECVAGVEEQLAAHNGAGSSGTESIAGAALRPSDRDIVISRCWDGVSYASGGAEEIGVCIARP